MKIIGHRWFNAQHHKREFMSVFVHAVVGLLEINEILS